MPDMGCATTMPDMESKRAGRQGWKSEALLTSSRSSRSASGGCMPFVRARHQAKTWEVMSVQRMAKYTCETRMIHQLQIWDGNEGFGATCIEQHSDHALRVRVRCYNERRDRVLHPTRPIKT
eukprot:1818396-Rhodomonas_salina.9